VHGRDVTPFLLARFHAETGGESLRANVRLVLRNAELAARIAVAVAASA
jgi:pseudouridine-5'-phosphate glycosidase